MLEILDRHADVDLSNKCVEFQAAAFGYPKFFHVFASKNEHLFYLQGFLPNVKGHDMYCCGTSKLISQMPKAQNVCKADITTKLFHIWNTVFLRLSN